MAAGSRRPPQLFHPSQFFETFSYLPALTDAEITKQGAPLHAEAGGRSGSGVRPQSAVAPPAAPPSVLPLIPAAVQYLLKNKWTPTVEFDFPSTSYAVGAFTKGFDSRRRASPEGRTVPFARPLIPPPPPCAARRASTSTATG